MGAWGTSLYSNDFARDLRPAIAAVCRLPLSEDELVELLADVAPGAARDTDDEEHSTFWLVLADQFEKRGIVALRVREKAIALIEGGDDLAMAARLGMSPRDLAKRKRMLDELLVRVTAMPARSMPRKTLAGPEPYALEVGTAYAYPLHNGRALNPYFTPKVFDRAKWVPNGTGVLLVVEAGRAFGFLAWYRPLVYMGPAPTPPSGPELAKGTTWELRAPGTCSRAHLRKMELTPTATFAIDPDRVAAHLPRRSSATHKAVNDISIANSISGGSAEYVVRRLEALLRG